jgi:hypothetical protein
MTPVYLYFAYHNGTIQSTEGAEGDNEVASRPRERNHAKAGLGVMVDKQKPVVGTVNQQGFPIPVKFEVPCWFWSGSTEFHGNEARQWVRTFPSLVATEHNGGGA